jgi:hypothetical protein
MYLRAILLKGTASHDFQPQVSLSNNSSWDTDPWVKAFFNIDLYSPWNSTLKSLILWAVSMTTLSFGGRCQLHRWPSNFFEHIHQLLSYANFVKNLVVDEQWWAVSVTPLITSGRCQWHRASILTLLTPWTLHFRGCCFL